MGLIGQVRTDPYLVPVSPDCTPEHLMRSVQCLKWKETLEGTDVTTVVAWQSQGHCPLLPTGRWLLALVLAEAEALCEFKPA